MTRRERIMATLRGEPVDRPAVNFFEVGGFKVDPDDTDPFNVYNDPSWRPLLRLARDRTDLMCMRFADTTDAPNSRRSEFFTTTKYVEDGKLCKLTRVRIGDRVLTELTKRDPDLDTVWVTEHMLKDIEDLKAYLQLPDEVFAETVNVSNLFEEEKLIGDRGVVMVEMPCPLRLAAPLFSMEDFTIVALTEQELFEALVEKMARFLLPRTEKVAKDFPGRLWRIFGSEFAAEPYLPPHLFERYFVKYSQPQVEAIHRYGGFARIHSHGRLKNIMPYIVGMHADAVDPVEPAPQGDVDLAELRREYGKDIVLMGNIEIRDVESMEPDDFEKVVAKSLRDGTSGDGRGFVLMPSSAPYGRCITPRTLANYETMVRMAEGFAV